MGLPRKKLVGGCLVIRFARAQDGARESWVVYGIGVMLSFEAKPRVPLIYNAPFANQRAVQKIPGIKLHPRLGRMNFHRSS
jgi:hypothetical protein